MDSTATHNSLENVLNFQYKTDQLKKLAALVCSDVPGRKDDRIKAIVSTFFKDPEAVFSQLTPLAQYAVEETIHTWNGIFNSRMFRAKYSASPWLKAKDEANRFTNKGDLLSLFIVGGTIPADLLEHLRDIVPHPPVDTIRYLESDPDAKCIVRETSQASLANVAMILQLTAENKIRVSAKTGRATAATCKMIGELLYEGDWYDDNTIGPMQAFAWPLLLQGGGLAKSAGSTLKLAPAGVKARKKDLAAGMRTAWNKWEKSKLIDEFSRVTAIKGQKSSGGRTMTSPVKRRPMINMLLEELQPGKWVTVEELSRLAQSEDEYCFSVTNYDWKLYFADPQYGHLDYNDTWPLLQFRYLLVYLFEYCATLGLVDVAYTEPHDARSDFRSSWGTDELEFLSHCDGLQYIRINDLGAYILGHTDIFTAKSDTVAIYAFDGRDILFIGKDNILPGQSLYLDKIAKRREIDRWRLSAPTLLGAISSGESLAEIQTTLTNASATPLSKELEQLFQEAEQRSTAFVEVGRPPLIECNAEMRNQVLTNKKLSRLCMPAGDRYLVIFPGKEKLFVSAIKALGFSISLDDQLS